VTLIGSLPKEYSSIVEIWELTHRDMRATPNLVSRLFKRGGGPQKDILE